MTDSQGNFGDILKIKPWGVERPIRGKSLVDLHGTQAPKFPYRVFSTVMILGSPGQWACL